MSTGSPEVDLTVHEYPADSRWSTLVVYVDSLQQMTRKAKATIAALSTLIVYVSVNSIARAVKPAAFVWYEEDKDEQSWIASSRSWFDRKSCRWLGVCGAAHFQTADAHFGQRDPTNWHESNDTNPEPWRSWWFSGANNQSEWDADEWARREIPDYVFDYAPLVHLYSGEQFWPGDIAEHLYHTTPMLNYTPIQAEWDHPSLEDLNQLNQWEGGRHVFLTSDDDVQTRPPWLEGERNIPQTDGEQPEEAWADWDGRVDGEIPDDTEYDHAEWFDLRGQEDDGSLGPESIQAHRLLRQELRKRYGGKKIQAPLRDVPSEGVGGRSDAPAILLVMDKGNGVVDAFWFFFYSFNLGNTVVNVRFGNHVGDWEHCLIRFHHGQPKALFFSAHTAGEAYRYEAVEKIGQRVSRQPIWTDAICTNLSSRSSTLPREAMPCMPPPECTSISYPGASYMMSQTAVRCGTLYSIPMHIPTISTTTPYAPRPSVPPHRQNGSTSAATGATSSTHSVTHASTASPVNTTT